MKTIVSKHSSCRITILIAGLILGMVTFLIPNFAQAADNDTADTSALAPPSLLGGGTPSSNANLTPEQRTQLPPETAETLTGAGQERGKGYTFSANPPAETAGWQATAPPEPEPATGGARQFYVDDNGVIKFTTAEEGAGQNADAAPEGTSEAPATEPTAVEQPTAVETPAVDAANHSDLSIDNLVLPSALEAQQDADLDQAFAALPTTAPDGTAPTINAEAVLAQRLAAIQDSAQEAAALGYGAPVAGARGLLGTPEEMGHAGRTHEEAGCLTMFQGSVGSGFEALTQGLPEGLLPPETIARFEAMHERFEQMTERFQTMMFGGPGGAGGNLPGAEGFAGPGGAPLPGAGVPIGGPEGFVMPAVGGFQFQDLGMMFGAAALGVDPAQFAQSMSQMIEARAEAFQNYFGQEGSGEHGTLPGFEGGTFAGFTPGGDNPLAAFLPGATPGDMPANAPSQFVGAFATAFNNEFAQQIAQQVTENIVQNVTTQIFNNLPPEALKVLQALNDNFTAADLTFLQNNPGQSITRAFSAEIADNYKGVAYTGLEHIHATYTRDPNTVGEGDPIMPFLDHVDANVTAIHSADHDPSKNVNISLEAGIDHIPGIQA